VNHDEILAIVKELDLLRLFKNNWISQLKLEIRDRYLL
jgi:hypothetical protein